MAQTALATIRPRLPMPAGLSVTSSQWRVLVDAIFPSAKTPEAVVLALDYCKARNLDPMKRPVHIVPMWSRAKNSYVETVWPGIGELEITASRTNAWAGMEAPKFGPMIVRKFEGTVRDDDNRGQNKKIGATVRFPEWCEVTVYKWLHGQKHPYTETVYWEEIYARIGRSEVPNDMWQKRPRGQLAKCAKAASLRAAFPEEVTDYAAEEMEGKELGQGGIVIDAEAEANALPPPPIEPEDPPPTDVAVTVDGKAIGERFAGMKWRDMLAEIRREADDCVLRQSEEMLVALGDSPHVQYVYTHGSKQTQDECSSILAEAMAAVRDSVSPDGSGADTTE